MLHYSDFHDASSLAAGLSLFENNAALHSLLLTCAKGQSLTFWIGEDLASFSSQATSCSVLAIPYAIHQTIAGSIALLCPNRVSYQKLFALLKASSELISKSLTQSLYKFKISHRQPQAEQLDFKKQTALL